MLPSRGLIQGISRPAGAYPTLSLRYPVMAAAAALLALVIMAFGATGRAAAATHADCEFVLGFQALHAMAPDVVGECLDNERHDPHYGVTRQLTAGGVLLWHKATNWTAFTDGARTWVNGPEGLRDRLRTERFDWEPTLVVDATANDALTLAYVRKAIGFFEQNGLEATIAHYNSDASVEGERALLLMDVESAVVLAYRIVPGFVGAPVGPDYRAYLQRATAEGYWLSEQGFSPVTAQMEPRRRVAVLHKGLVFLVGHSLLRENVESATKEYVAKAIERYQQEGLDATIAYYSSEDSFEGQFYLFLIDANDSYLVHPIFPDLIGTDVKEVVASDGQELGKKIAQATADGLWVEYLWPHPVSRLEQKKVTWAIRHDGLIFASGYYVGEPETEEPAWRGADPQEYTVAYVERAIERYKRDGLESMLNYYNSVSSFEGQWYLFATDADDIYIAHALFPDLIGTDIKDVVGSDGFELGKALAAATEDGVWVEYLWPHPVTLREVPKVGYAMRYDGLLFASGYYPPEEDTAARTKAYVQAAIAFYQREGLEATVKHYSTQESFDGQWSLLLWDENGIGIASPVYPPYVGMQIEEYTLRTGREIGKEFVAAAQEGGWVTFIVPNPRASEVIYAHRWFVTHDGLIFASTYYDDRPTVPVTLDDDALTRA